MLKVPFPPAPPVLDLLVNALPPVFELFPFISSYLVFVIIPS